MKKSSMIVAGAAAVVAGWAGVAGAQTSYAGDEENEAVVQAELPAPSSTETAAVQVQGNAQQNLPVTGSNTGTLALAGAVLVAGGGALVWRSRAAAQA